MNKNILVFFLFAFVINLKAYCQLDTIKTADFSICVPSNSKLRVTNTKTIKLSVISKIGDNIRNIIVQKVDPNPIKINDVWDLNDEQIKEKLFFLVNGQTFFQSFERRKINDFKFVTIYHTRKMSVSNRLIEIKTQSNYLVKDSSLFVVELSCLIENFNENKDLFDNIMKSFKFFNLK
jgi:hypothetical protein